MKDMNSRKEIGKAGEDIACEYLRGKGYEIIRRNFRCKQGEVDIVAQKGGVLCFIEVKTRTSNQYGYPEESVNFNKKRHIRDTAKYYIMKNDLSEVDFQFDVITVELSHIKNCM